MGRRRRKKNGGGGDGGGGDALGDATTSTSPVEVEPSTNDPEIVTNNAEPELIPDGGTGGPLPTDAVVGGGGDSGGGVNHDRGAAEGDSSPADLESERAPDPLVAAPDAEPSAGDSSVSSGVTGTTEAQVENTTQPPVDVTADAKATTPVDAADPLTSGEPSGLDNAGTGDTDCGGREQGVAVSDDPLSVADAIRTAIPAGSARGQILPDHANAGGEGGESSPARSGRGGVTRDSLIDPHVAIARAIRGSIPREDIERTLGAQAEALERLGETRRSLAAVNDDAERRFEELGPEFARHTAMLDEMRADLATVFRRIRTLRDRLRKARPDAFPNIDDSALPFEE